MKKGEMDRLVVRVDDGTKRKWDIYCAVKGTKTQQELERFVRETLEQFEKEHPGIFRS
ncbi:hypothetical protein [Lihuaxuella thermophila]|uniref:Uncharacterized protein n=1 Tax=Lihuaxuella thermophila TaxID=1173111 RepID=A0A1H8FJB5_9BACL|nr:hypothetical protein [Lihuaxuella thermophila]SEN31809.1 hypothetical protein SAMN05444955_108224 [Lihuaxuella thermophila]